VGWTLDRLGELDVFVSSTILEGGLCKIHRVICMEKWLVVRTGRNDTVSRPRGAAYYFTPRKVYCFSKRVVLTRPHNP
jgi:hypothetical protein